MTSYNYQCTGGCTIRDYIEKPVPVFEIFVNANVEDYKNEPFVWEVSHSIMEDPVIKCPICAVVSSRTLAGCKISGYIKGNGYLDKAGVRREMNRRTLIEADPYASIRPDGDKEDMLKKIDKTGQSAMKYKVRGDQNFIKPLDMTNIEAVQAEKKERMQK